MAPLSVSDLSRNKAIKRLDFPSLLPAPIEEVWRVTTDFDFVVHLLKPWFTITYDRSNAGHELAAGWTKDTDWKLLGIIPYGRWHEEIVEWEPPVRLRYRWHLFFDPSDGREFTCCPAHFCLDRD